MTETRIDDCLSNRDGVLYIEELASTELVERFGSPLFVFSENQIRRNVRRFKNAFEKGWTAGPVKVMPAVKANWTWLFAPGWSLGSSRPMACPKKRGTSGGRWKLAPG